MSVSETISNASLDQRVVLLGAVVASTDRETPVNPAELRRVCNERLATAETPVVGGLSEADVTRALYALEADGLVENVAEGNTSPTGKGRPAYKLLADPAEVRDALAADDALASVLEALED